MRIFLLRLLLYMLYILIQYCYYTIVLSLLFKYSLFILFRHVASAISVENVLLRTSEDRVLIFVLVP